MTLESLKANYSESFVQFRKLLDKYERLFLEAVEKGGQAEDVPALMIKYAFLFGQNTIDAIQILIEGHNNSIFLCTLCRPYYELSIRILWAAREAYGWQRLQAYLSTQDMRWAEEAIGMPEIAVHAEKILAASREVLSRKDPNDKPYTPAPGIQQMLKDIEDCDVSQGIREKGGNVAAYEYTNIYRVICRPAHAHMQAISLEPTSFLNPTVFATGIATFSLLRSVLYTSPENLSKQVKDIELQVVDIMKQCFKFKKGSSKEATSKSVVKK